MEELWHVHITVGNSGFPDPGPVGVRSEDHPGRGPKKLRQPRPRPPHATSDPEFPREPQVSALRVPSLYPLFRHRAMRAASTLPKDWKPEGKTPRAHRRVSDRFLQTLAVLPPACHARSIICRSFRAASSSSVVAGAPAMWFTPSFRPVD